MIFLKGDDFEGGRLKGAKLRLFNKLPSPHKQSTIHYLVSIFGYSEASWLCEANFNYLNHFQHTLVLPHPHRSNELIMLYHWVLGKKRNSLFSGVDQKFWKARNGVNCLPPTPLSPDLRAEDHHLFSFFLPFSFLLSLSSFFGGVVVVLSRRPAEIPEPGVEYEPQQWQHWIPKLLGH